MLRSEKVSGEFLGRLGFRVGGRHRFRVVSHRRVLRWCARILLRPALYDAEVHRRAMAFTIPSADRQAPPPPLFRVWRGGELIVGLVICLFDLLHDLIRHRLALTVVLRPRFGGVLE